MKPSQNNEKRPAAPRPQESNSTPPRKKRRRLHPAIRFIRRSYRILVRALRIPQIHLDGFLISKGIVCGALILLLALLQTTLLARFRPFGAIPDLMLSAVIAIAVLEGEKWGCLIGLLAALVIESMGGGAIQLLPLLFRRSRIDYHCDWISIISQSLKWSQSTFQLQIRICFPPFLNIFY